MSPTKQSPLASYSPEALSPREDRRLHALANSATCTDRALQVAAQQVLDALNRVHSDPMSAVGPDPSDLERARQTVLDGALRTGFGDDVEAFASWQMLEGRRNAALLLARRDDRLQGQPSNTWECPVANCGYGIFGLNSVHEDDDDVYDEDPVEEHLRNAHPDVDLARTVTGVGDVTTTVRPAAAESEAPSDLSLQSWASIAKSMATWVDALPKLTQMHADFVEASQRDGVDRHGSSDQWRRAFVLRDPARKRRVSVDVVNKRIDLNLVTAACLLGPPVRSFRISDDNLRTFYNKGQGYPWAENQVGSSSARRYLNVEGSVFLKCLPCGELEADQVSVWHEVVVGAVLQDTHNDSPSVGVVDDPSVGDHPAGEAPIPHLPGTTQGGYAPQLQADIVQAGAREAGFAGNTDAFVTWAVLDACRFFDTDSTPSSGQDGATS